MEHSRCRGYPAIPLFFVRYCKLLFLVNEGRLVDLARSEASEGAE
jgi:hypothetical protein